MPRLPVEATPIQFLVSLPPPGVVQPPPMHVTNPIAVPPPQASMYADPNQGMHQQQYSNPGMNQQQYGAYPQPNY
ncbi:hypothetical protein GEMRC1_003539 [Eukaryota sp. GEM-RC1]